MEPVPGSTIECVPPAETACGYIDSAQGGNFVVDLSTGFIECDQKPPNGQTCWFTCNDPTHYTPLSLVQCKNTGLGYAYDPPKYDLIPG